MKRTSFRVIGIATIVAVLSLLAGCATLDVKVPGGMFLSTGDYVPNIRTLGVIQEKTSVFAPLFLVDINRVNQDLYLKLIERARAIGADGVSNVRFTWAPSPFMALSILIASGWFDYYAEGIAIKK